MPPKGSKKDQPKAAAAAAAPVAAAVAVASPKVEAKKAPVAAPSPKLEAKKSPSPEPTPVAVAAVASPKVEAKKGSKKVPAVAVEAAATPAIAVAAAVAAPAPVAAAAVVAEAPKDASAAKKGKGSKAAAPAKTEAAAPSGDAPAVAAAAAAPAKGEKKEKTPKVKPAGVEGALAGAEAPKGEKKEKAKKEKNAKVPAAAAAAGESKDEAGDDEDDEKKAGPWVAPEFMLHRMAVWDAVAARQAAEKKVAPIVELKISTANGRVLQAVAGVTTPFQIAKELSNSLAKEALVAKLTPSAGGAAVLWDMARPLEFSCEIAILTFESKEGQHTFWHSSAHILGQAMEKEFKDIKLCVGPPIEDGGFYYDAEMGDQHVLPAHYKSLEKTIKFIAKAKQPFVRLVLTKDEALEMFKHNQFKQEIIRSKVPDGVTCTAYRCGPLIDLCKGPHLPDTAKVQAMTVLKHSSAYWLGKSENPSLQRVYGISFPNKTQLTEYKDRMKKAEERDHRRIGLQQKLFFFNILSPGSAFFLPHGTRLYNRLQNFIRDQYRQRGYTEVVTPNVYSTDLWKTSGHYQNYKENMFLFKCEGQEFALKPMNCPGHCVMFGHTLRSYRELPIRYADFGTLHRNELSGALSGLTRVRRFQQDDAHIFCRPEQIGAEVGGVLDFLQAVYGIFGFEFQVQLSTRPENFLGEVSTWDRAEKQLGESLDKFGKPWTINPGDGAFYGPKVDIKLFDALHRQHQCATIQLDFQLPQRFGLQYKTAGDAFETPVIIHRAILGSVERMVAVLIEHTGGKWPFWLNPRQIVVVPVSEKSLEYAERVYKQIFAAGFYVDLDASDEQLKKKIAMGQVEQYNFILVVGEDEAVAGTVTVRERDNPKVQVTCTITEFVERCQKLTAAFL